jgi:uncharacterized RDD family membrane protein YckC
MNSPVAGDFFSDEVFGCPSEPLPHQLSRAHEVPVEAAPDCPVEPTEALVPGPEVVEDPSDEPPSDAWRNELSARLGRYRARRKMPPPRYPSLRLQFDAFDSSATRANEKNEKSDAFVRTDFEPISDHALALDSSVYEAPVDDSDIGSHASSQPSIETQVSARISTGAGAGAKIIEFPRSAWAPPPPPLDQLAEPVFDRPRILDVPDIPPPAPALGGITISAAEKHEAEKRPGIDLPLQSASLPRRILAAAVDGSIIASASALFGYIFWKVTGIQPPTLEIVAMAAGISVLLWAAYQYLLMVYSARTPGLRVAGLELTRFDGSATTRSLRRWRVLASYLSAASLGMGYAWLFLDEDILCWHDRITHTYLAPTKQTTPASQ